jgi:hypothetical protein
MSHGGLVRTWSASAREVNAATCFSLGDDAVGANARRAAGGAIRRILPTHGSARRPSVQMAREAAFCAGRGSHGERFHVASPEIVPSGQFTRIVPTKVLRPLIPWYFPVPPVYSNVPGKVIVSP